MHKLDLVFVVELVRLAQKVDMSPARESPKLLKAGFRFKKDEL